VGFLETIGSLLLSVIVAGMFGGVVAAFSRRIGGLLPEGSRRWFSLGVFGVFGLLALVWMLQADRADRFLASSEAAKLATTLWGVILAVTVSGVVFVAANLLFNQARTSFSRFSALMGGLIGFVTFGLLDGNRLIQHVNGRDGLSESLHDIVNANEWTLLFFSLVIAGLIGAGLGSAIGVVRDSVERFQLGGLLVGLLLGLMWGLFFAERIPVDTAVSLLWTPLLGAILVGALGYGLAQLDQPVRLGAGIIGGAVIGLVLGGLAFTSIVPRIELISAIIWPVALAVVGGGVSRLRGQSPIGGAIVGALIGWIIGVFVVTGTGGPRAEAFSAFGVAGALAGARFSYRPRPTQNQLTDIENRSRSWIFVSPALFFVGVGLVASLIRSLMLSFERTFRDDAGQRIREFPSLENYRKIFGNDANLELGGWRDLFTSAPFEVGMVLVAVALAAGLYLGRRSGNTFAGSRYIVPVLGLAMLAGAYYQLRLITADDSVEEAIGATLLAQESVGVPAWRYIYLALFVVVGLGLLGLAATGGRLAGLGAGGDGPSFDLAGGHGAAFAFGGFLLITGIFAAVRGTVINSIWWVFMVTVLATAFGLAIAALADRAKMENVAKSIIFMPLAISFVGAGIIWRFMYIARPGDNAQTGLLNWAWVGLGDLSLSSSRWIVVAVLAVILVALAWLGMRGWQSGAYGLLGGSLMLGLPLLWLVWRLAAGRLGGTGVDGAGERTVIFLSQNLPYNNLWLMVVLIWIQTGFAMVIFSAAIKAVPQEYIEAAKVDGATDSSIFWRIIVPSIVPTIGVVVTTLMVSVLKIFDVVKVMTNGNFESQIVANEMIFQAFTVGDRGLGSALAIVLFLAVLPVLYMNIRRLQQEGV